MTRHRSLVVVVFALPLSLLWDMLLWLRQLIVFWMQSAPYQHPERVRRVAAQVKARPKGMRMCTGRPGWQSMSLSYRDCKFAITPPARFVGMSQLLAGGSRPWRVQHASAALLPCSPGRVPSLVCSPSRGACTDKSTSHRVTTICEMIDIVSIDLDSAQPTMTVEPLVTCGQLTHALLSLGYTLAVVPEMDDLTVGGLVNGTGIESSSHRHGLFHEQCVAFEVCLADGTVVLASEDDHAELFHAIPWSYGTLGLLLSVTLKITRCKPLVELTYYPYTDKAAALGHFARLSEAGDEAPDFVEALAFSATDYVVMKGMQVDRADTRRGNINTISRWYKPWFFKHVEAKLRDGGKPSVEFLPLRDYYHRHTRSMFWEMELMLPIGNQPLARFLFGWALPPKVSFLKLTQSEMTRRLTQQTHVAQDFMLPMDELPGLMELCDEVYDKLYPVWLCPHAHRPMPGTIMPDPPKPGADGSQMYVDVGVCTRRAL